MTDETDNLEDNVELILEEDEHPSNTISFATRKKFQQDTGSNQSNQDLLNQGVDAFGAEIAEQAKGFVAIIFDKDNNPRIISAGEFDLMYTLGALEVLKNEFVKNILPTPEG